jgi:hypothetical protein
MFTISKKISIHMYSWYTQVHLESRRAETAS